MAAIDLNIPTKWRKSSRSTGTGQDQCVEVADSGANTLIRDTKSRELGHVAITQAAWNNFTCYIKQKT
ncbi:DUF397 domain-containing protein [Actinokineospora sp. NBRC 105648]|uniref:DUF397 domain-containing protein n=1 Tax=Actinokineospora sp. NBRC 105648 TaxID=3032206 RepID=UPI002553A05A|nr:DUF397 domain-containing protein [Actinokineospora sp. NBRC 105648]